MRDLLDAALVHHHDPVRHGERLGLGVGDEHEGDAEVALQELQLGLDRLAQIGVQRAERFVQQQDVGLNDQPAGERDALALATGEPLGPLIGHVREAKLLEDCATFASRSARFTRLTSRPYATLLAHRHVRKQRVVLEDHRGRPPLGRQVVDAAAADQDVAARDRLEAGDHAQRRRLAAARGAEEGDELALAHGQVEPDDRGRAVVIDLADTDQLKVGHPARARPPVAWAGTGLRRPRRSLHQALRNSSHFWIRWSYSSGHWCQ